MSEELLVRHCSPTLAGIKTANMFSCKYTSNKALKNYLSNINSRLSKKGVNALLLKSKNNTALIYLYRPNKLHKDLKNDTAHSILQNLGYNVNTCSSCIEHLKRRLETCDVFPHEIGLFLGYPPEDVYGFILNNARSYKCSGYWKVYTDTESAIKTFKHYKKCTDVYSQCFSKGLSLDKLTISA